MRILTVLSLSAGLVMAAAAPGFAVDERAAEQLARDSDCTKCHSVSRKKDGPSFKSIAEKYQGKPDAVEKLTKHVTSTPMVEVDGKEEKHPRVETEDPAEIKNLVEWVLSR